MCLFCNDIFIDLYRTHVNKVNSPIRIGDSVKKEKLCKNEGSMQSFFYWLGLGLLLFYLDDVIIQIADSFLQAIVHQTKSGVVNNHEIHRSFTILRS